MNLAAPKVASAEDDDDDEEDEESDTPGAADALTAFASHASASRFRVRLPSYVLANISSCLV